MAVIVQIILKGKSNQLKKSKAHYAELKFEIYDDYTKTNITRDQMAKKDCRS